MYYLMFSISAISLVAVSTSNWFCKFYALELQRAAAGWCSMLRTSNNEHVKYK